MRVFDSPYKLTFSFYTPCKVTALWQKFKSGIIKKKTVCKGCQIPKKSPGLTCDIFCRQRFVEMTILVGRYFKYHWLKKETCINRKIIGPTLTTQKCKICVTMF